MLPRQRLLRRLLTPSLLEHPPSRSGARKKAVRSTSDGVPLRRRLDRDPHLRISPTKSHQVRSGHVSWELHCGARLPPGSVRFRGGVGARRASWNFCFVFVPPDPNRHRPLLGYRHYSEEEGDLAARRALQAKVWQGLVGPSPRVTGVASNTEARCST